MKIPKIRDDEIVVACRWACADAEDDFCPDYVNYADYQLVSSEHMQNLRASCLRPDMHHLARLVVPRGAGILSRETPWLPFPLRVTYMLLIRRLLPALRTYISPSCHSSRLEEWKGDAYPWHGPRVAPFARFNNEYRKLLIDQGLTGLAIETDITAFYENINIVQFVEVIGEVLQDKASTLNDELRSLRSLLLTAALKGRGLLQNMDPSRLLADAYLRVVDDRVRAISGLSYLRWVDDIRIVAGTRAAAVRGFQQLESHLKMNGFFLNSRKTLPISPQDAEWAKAKEADHDFRLAHCDELARMATKDAVEECLRVAVSEMRAALERGEDALARAYGARVLRVAEFSGARSTACSQLETVALQGFRLHPGEANHWARFASPAPSAGLVGELLSILNSPDHNCHPWANMWAIIAMARAENLPGEALDMLRSIVMNRGEQDYLRGWAAVAFARHGDGLQRRHVVDACLAEGNSMFLRRAAVVAAQELASGTRGDVRAQTTSRDPLLVLLWDYLEKRAVYDWYAFPARDFAEPGAKPEEAPSFEAVGFVKGRLQTFRAYSRGSDY